MHVRPMRTLVAILAAFGLLAGVAALPAAAATCTAAGDTTAEAGAITFDASFHCADADASGTWSITVEVANGTDADVTISELELAGVTPAIAASADASGALTSDSLPVTIAAGATGSFDASGDYVLAELGTSALLNLHLRASGTADDAPVTLAVNVHLRGAGLEATDAEADAAVEGAAVAEIASDAREDGKPDWLPGPPPWVVALIAHLHPDGLAAAVFAGSEAAAVIDFGGAVEGDAETETDTTTSEETTSRVPAHVTLPAQAAAAAGAGAGEDGEDELTVEIEVGASGQVVVPPIGGRP